VNEETDLPIINVNMLPGRTLDQKRELVRELTDAFVRTCGSKTENVRVLITETPGEHWGIGGELVADR
jgi:4-oxalocrotonate tautomerase